jgi:HlyD family secretion protein
MEQHPLPTIPLQVPPPQVTKTETIRILVVDDQYFVRKMLQYSLEPEVDFEIIGTAESGQAALQQIQDLQPDIALVDIEMPDSDGLALTHTLSDRYPHTKVLVLSMHDDETYIRAALQAGARGYLLKNTPSEELAHAIRFVQRGYLQLGPGLFEKLDSPVNSLPLAATSAAVSAPILKDESTLEAQPAKLPGDDWTTVTQEFVSTTPKVWLRGLVYLLALSVALIVPWTFWAKVDEVVLAKGKLEPQGKLVQLDAAVEGTIAAVQIQEGQEVRKGQPILELQTDLITADLQQAQAKLNGLLERRTQLALGLTQAENGRNTARQQARAQAAAQQAGIDKLRQQQVDLQESLKLAQNLLAKDREKVTRYQFLRAQGAIDRVEVDQVERTQIENTQKFQKTQSDIAQAGAEIQKQQRESERIIKEGELTVINQEKQIQDIQSQIADVQSQILQTQRQIKALLYQRAQRAVYAPFDGTVFQLPLRNPGAVVKPGQIIAQLAPKTARSVLRAQVDAKDAGFLKVGLPVRLKFDAYPFQDYGLLQGKISWISPDSKAPPAESAPSSSPGMSAMQRFELEIELATAIIQTPDKQISLKPGQTATAEIITRQRRLIDFFLDPFRKLRRDGLKV